MHKFQAVWLLSEELRPRPLLSVEARDDMKSGPYQDAPRTDYNRCNKIWLPCSYLSLSTRKQPASDRPSVLSAVRTGRNLDSLQRCRQETEPHQSLHKVHSHPGIACNPCSSSAFLQGILRTLHLPCRSHVEI